MERTTFEWDNRKSDANLEKHGVSFFEAQQAFLDSCRVIAEDVEHSKTEARYYCFGKVNGAVMTVRFIYKDQTIRIFGAGYWRKGRKIYEETQK
jgi:uncharacterized DUF497 family protein